MTDTLSLGWSQNEARTRIKAFQTVLAVNLVLQSLIALAVILWPAAGVFATGVPAAATGFAPFWAGMVLFASALQVPFLLDPIRLRTPLLVALLGRLFMVLLYLFHLPDYWRLALFDGVFAIILIILLQRAAIAEMQSRP